MILQREEYQHRIKERLVDYPVLALLGPRQVGKTTIARTFGKMLTPENQVHFFDLESPADLARLSNPELVLESLHGLVVLDEINIAVNYGFIHVDEVRNLLLNMPKDVHLVLGGRYAKTDVMKHATVVMEMKEVKHPFKNGIGARRGIEY